MSKSTVDALESRVRTTLRDVETAELTDTTSSRRSEGGGYSGRGIAMFATIMLVAVGSVASFSAWRSQHQNPTTVKFLAGSETFDTLLMVDSVRGPFERELGTAFGSPIVALSNARATAETGCATTPSILVPDYLDPSWRSMTVSAFVAAHGTGMLDIRTPGTCGLPTLPVPVEIRTLENRLTKWFTANEPTNECLNQMKPAIDAVQREVSSHSDAIQNGAYGVPPKLRQADADIALELHRCQAIERQKLQRATADFLVDQENLRLLNLAATFIKATGLALP
jgi:hypothetical protein